MDCPSKAGRVLYGASLLPMVSRITQLGDGV